MTVKSPLFSKASTPFLMALLSALLFVVAIFFFLFNDSSLDHYEFSYSSMQIVSNTGVETTVRKCVSFDPTETSLDEVTQKFIKNHEIDGELRVVNGCDSEIGKLK